MKKIMTMLALVLTVSTSFAFTGGEDAINQKVLNSFKNEFAGATNIVWTATSDNYKVTFNMGDQNIFAYYDAAGKLIGVTRNLSSLDLPLKLQMSLKKSYTNYWVSDLFEVSNSNGSSYYLTLETADSKIILKSTDGGNWSTAQKIEKE